MIKLRTNAEPLGPHHIISDMSDSFNQCRSSATSACCVDDSRTPHQGHYLRINFKISQTLMFPATCVLPLDFLAREMQ